MEPPEKLILHEAMPYDAVKAHQYYLRTRALKGRQGPRKIPQVVRRRPAAVRRATAPRVVPKLAASPAKHNKEIQVRVKALEVRLKKLRLVLKRILDEVQHRAPDKTKAAKEKTKAKAAGSKKLTSAQKREAAVKAKKRYEKEHPASLDEQQKQVQEKIKAVEKRIANAKEDLKASIARAREASPQPAASSRRS